MDGGPSPSSQGGQWINCHKVPHPQASGINRHSSLGSQITPGSGEAHRYEHLGRGYGWNSLEQGDVATSSGREKGQGFPGQM